METINEVKVYIVNADIYFLTEENDNKSVFDMTDEEFMAEAEKQDNVYSLSGFEDAFNNEEVCTFIDYIKIR